MPSRLVATDEHRAVALQRLMDTAASRGLLAEGLTAGKTEEVLPWILRLLVDALDVDFAFVGELGGEHWDRMHTLAAAAREGTFEPFDYDVQGTPCERVVNGHRHCVRERVQEQFPEAEALAKLGVQAYVGAPLADAANRPLGSICLLSKRPIEDAEVMCAALEVFAGRISAKLEHARALHELRLVIEGTGGLSSSDIFEALVRNLAHVLHVRLAMVAELVEPLGRVVRTLALWDQGRMLDNVEYDLAGTPCERVYERNLCFHAQGVADLYPRDEMLRDMGAESYMGVPFFSSTGERIGHMCVIHDRPISAEMHSQSLFRVFANRAGAELERRRAEDRRLRLERSLLEAQKLESLGILAGGVAHDFNNLLVGIIGNASLALAEAPSDSPLRTYLEEVETSGQRCADLARQLLAFSGKGRFEVEPLDLGALVDDMRQLLQTSVPERVTLRAEIPADLPTVTADATQIRQLVMNLVINACEAIGDEEGQVSITGGRKNVDQAYLDRAAVGHEAPPGEYVFLEVRDTGRGMDADTLPRIFDPFFTTKFTGRGLGLAAAQGIVRGHGGALVVSSAPGGGSSFVLLLPIGTEPSASKMPQARADSSGWRGQGLVVVADDEGPVRVAAANMLRHLGFDVELATDGHQAIEVSARRHGEVRAVLLDMTMPGPGAEEVVSALRHDDPDIKIILMSGYDEFETGDRFAGVGLSGFVHKPFRLEDLRARLRSALGG